MECGKASRLFAGGGDGDDYHVWRFFAVDILVGNLSDHRGAGHRCARRPCRVTPVAGIVTEPCQRVGRCFGGDCLDAARFRDVPHPGLGRGACELKGRVGGGEVKSAPLKRKAAGVVHCQSIEGRAADSARSRIVYLEVEAVARQAERAAYLRRVAVRVAATHGAAGRRGERFPVRRERKCRGTRQCVGEETAVHADVRALHTVGKSEGELASRSVAEILADKDMACLARTFEILLMEDSFGECSGLRAPRSRRA